MFDAYKIGVTLSLTDNVSKGLKLLAGDFEKTEAQAAALQKRIDNIKTDVLKGGRMIGVGFDMLALFKAPLDAARDYELAFTKFKTMNLGDVVNQQADKFARSANLVGVTSKELMNTLSESVGLFGNFDLAKKVSPVLAQLNKANSAIFQGKIDQFDEGSTRSLMNFIDRRGGNHDEATFMHNLNVAQRIATGSGGALKFRDLDQFSQMGGAAFRGLSDDGIVNMALLSQGSGGAKAGTSLMSLYQNLVDGRTSKKSMAKLQEFGLGTLAMQEHGKSMVMTNIKGADLLQSDPAKWMQTVFLPALAAKGITDQPGILKMTNGMLSNRNGSIQESIMTPHVLQLLRDQNLAKNAMGVDATIDTYKKDPNTQFADLQAKYNKLMVELGITVLPLAIRALERIIPLLNDTADWINRNTTLVKGLVYAFSMLAGGLAIRGTVVLLRAAFRGLGVALGFSQIGGEKGISTLATSMGGFSKALGIVGTTLSAFAWAGIALEIARILGLPDTDKEKGMEDVKAGRWLSASFNLPAADFIRAVINNADLSFGPRLNPAMSDKPGGFYDQRSKNAANRSRMDGYTPSTSKPIQVTTEVNMDGFRVASIVSTHQSKAVSGPQLGTGRFDMNLGLISPGQAIR